MFVQLVPRISVLAAALVLLGTRALAQDDDPRPVCTVYVTARAGDSCASVATAAGIDVAQFMRLNPTLEVCTLQAGTTYCISDAPPPATATPSPAPTTPPSRTTSGPPYGNSSSVSSSSTAEVAATPTAVLIPSPDGSDGVCGGSYTCLGSVYGDCCSENGYCGNTTEYCGEGCNPLFGRCGGGEPVCQSGGVVTVTIIELPTACTAVGPQRTVTQTATIVSLRTVTSVRTVTADRTVTVVAPGAEATSSPKPSPILPGTIATCKKYYLFKIRDRCARIAFLNGITEDDLYNWNPNLDCDDPFDMAGDYICVGV